LKEGQDDSAKFMHYRTKQNLYTMTSIEEIVQAIVNINVWLVVKIFVLIALGLYIIFGFIIVREVDLMNKTLKGVFNLPIKIIACLHLIFSVFIFILAMIVL